jgi:hypothetical protein
VGGGISSGNDAAVGGSADPSSLTVTGGAIARNLAEGGLAGSAAVAGNGWGGGVFIGAGTATIDGTFIVFNEASGRSTGHGIGGGVYISSGASAKITKKNFVVFNFATTSDDDIFGVFTT